LPTSSFDDFVAERLGPLLRYATALSCDPHLAQDIVQEVMLRAQQHWTRIAATDHPQAYVKRMVTNEYLSWRRRRAARDVALAHTTLDEISPPVADQTGHYDEREAMLARIARLPRKQRAAIVLRYYENMVDSEISEVLGCSQVTVRSHVSRALAALRAQEPTIPTDQTKVSWKGLDHAH
jgi:RNA polymerase sigma-70 factor (sigma-E family)